MHYFQQDFIQQNTSTSILKHLGNVDARIAYTQKFIQKSILRMILLLRCHGLNPWVQSGVHINGSHFLMLVSLVCIVLALRLRPFLSFTPLTIVHEMCINKATLYNKRGIVDGTHFIDASLLAMFAKYSIGFYLNCSNLLRILEKCKLRLVQWTGE